MDYNTTRKKLILPEYGRSIQQMVDYIVTVDDRDERNRLAKSLIAVMGTMNPQYRDVNDFKHKLWDHLFIMSDFKLDIDSPYPVPTRETYAEKPQRIEYNKTPVHYKHYGRIIEDMVNKALEMEEGEKRDALKMLIANQMKKTNVAWNKESVSDEDIFCDLYQLSDGKLRAQAGTKLVEVKEVKSNGGNGKTQGGKKSGKRQRRKKG